MATERTGRLLGVPEPDLRRERKQNSGGLEPAAGAGDDGPRDLGGAARENPLSRALVPSNVAIDQMREADARWASALRGLARATRIGCAPSLTPPRSRAGRSRSRIWPTWGGGRGQGRASSGSRSRSTPPGSVRARPRFGASSTVRSSSWVSRSRATASSRSPKRSHS